MVLVGDEKLATNRKADSVLEGALSNAMLPLHPSPAPWWGLVGIPHESTDVCGFVKPPSQKEWFVRKHGALEIGRQELGLSRNFKQVTTRPGYTCAVSILRACRLEMPGHVLEGSNAGVAVRAEHDEPLRLKALACAQSRWVSDLVSGKTSC